MADQHLEENEDFPVSNIESDNRKTSGRLRAVPEKILDEQRKIITTYKLYDLEAEIRKLKRSLENWREVILPVSSVLKWEKNWYPGAIVAGTTLLFLVLWLLEPSVLTTISLLGLTITVSDYIVPLLVATLYKTDSWTAKKELELEGICRSLVIYKTKVYVSCSSYYKMRSTRPKLFYLCTIVSLAVMAYIGNLFNNLFLTYLLTTAFLLTPGLIHFGLLNKYLSILSRTVLDVTDNVKTKVGQMKKEH